VDAEVYRSGERHSVPLFAKRLAPCCRGGLFGRCRASWNELELTAT